VKAKTRHNIAVALLCLAPLSGCVSGGGPKYISQNNVYSSKGGYNMISLQQEIEIGQHEFAKIKAKKPLTSDISKQQAARRVLNHLVKANNLQNDYPWEIVVFADNTPNAFALPGGKIAIYDGIFKYTQNDEDLAAVISHEMVHITARHATQLVSRRMSAGLVGVGPATFNGGPNTAQDPGQTLDTKTSAHIMLPYLREAEFEADRIGLLYMARAGYNPKASLRVWKRFVKSAGPCPPKTASTHPFISERIKQIEMNLPHCFGVYNNSSRS